MSLTRPTSLTRWEAKLLGLLSFAVDLGPDALRYGIGHSLRKRLMAGDLPSFSAAEVPAVGGVALEQERPVVMTARVVLVTASLGTGGVEAIVATLARQLPHHGVAVTVLCHEGGQTAESLRADGVRVIEARGAQAVHSALEHIPSTTIAQLHNAPSDLVTACMERGMPLMPVIHTTDINMSPAKWDAQASLWAAAKVSVAVSSTTRSFHLDHLPGHNVPRVEVIPNGVDPISIKDGEIADARAALSSLTGEDLSDGVVFTCLARYDFQKNIPGLVAAFNSAARVRDDIHLVVAGPVGDWVEYRRADAVRRIGHPGRIHLLGVSSSRRLLAASDVFVLNSFFEGWPVSATEAAMAGLPLLMSEVGGAVELVGVEGRRGHLFPNPAGDGGELSLRSIARARLRSERQVNHMAAATAILSAAGELPSWRARRSEMAMEARSWLSAQAMVAKHAALIGHLGDHRDGRDGKRQG